MSKVQPTYRRILTSFWTDPDVRHRRFTIEQKILLLYLFTSPHSNLAGLYWLPLEYAAAETGLELADVVAWILGPLSPYVTYDEETQEVLVHRLAKHNIGEDLKAKDNRVKALERGLLDIHSKPLLRKFFHIYAEWPLDPTQFLQTETPEPAKTHTPTTETKGLTQGAYPSPSEGARGSHSSIKPVSEQLHTHALQGEGASKPLAANPRVGHEHEVSHTEASNLRDRDRTVILERLHLGAPTVTVNGKSVSMELEMHIRDKLAAEYGARAFSLALAKVRDVEDIPPTEPISLRLLESHPEVISRALAAAALDDGLGPGPSPAELGVTMRPMPTAAKPTTDLRAEARRKLEQARSAS